MITKPSIQKPDLENMPQEMLKQRQIKPHKKKVKNCCENVATYKNKSDEIRLKPSDIKILEDLSNLPDFSIWN